MNRVAKALKWGASALRVARVRVVGGNRLKIASGKPLYLGKGARVILGEGASLSIGAGVYLSPECFIQVNKRATLVLEDGVYMNEGCRVTVVESAHIGADTLFGPNVQIYDHDHEFDWGGPLGAASRTGFDRTALLAVRQRGRHAWLHDRGSFARLGELRRYARPSRKGRTVRRCTCSVD